jgi:hypothetical protein
MSVAHQPTLLGGLAPAPGPTAAWSRVRLDATSWVDVARDWWTGADTLLDELTATVGWKQGRRKMWDRVLDDPRLSYWGRDVADRVLRRLGDTLDTIVTLGTQRPFLVRPKGGGTSVDLAPASSDLLVMGGACQRDWEHTVPKTARAGPRVSVSWRSATAAPRDR